MQKGAQEMERLAVGLDGAAHGFTIYGDVFVFGSQGEEPSPQCMVDGCDVYQTHDPPDGRFAWGFVSSGVEVFPAPEPFPGCLGGVLGPLTHGDKAPGPGQDGADGDGQHSSQGMPESMRLSALRQRPEDVPEGVQLSDGNGHGFHWAFQLHRWEGMGQPFQGVAVEWLDQEDFWIAVTPVFLGIFCEPLGLSKWGPSCGLVAGPDKPGGVDECFHQQNWIAMDLLPILAQTTRIECKNPGCEVRDADPGKDQKS